MFQNEHLWYRGLANNNYKLLPSLYRIKDYSFEDEVKIRNEFIDKAKGFVKYSNLTNYEWYFLMQHYGLPTRLLDWTEGYLIALFFALRLSQNDNVHINPCIWIISPSKLNKITVGLDRIIRTEKVRRIRI
ncbi:FRG domain-containing protein [Pedobacter panaciterrae]